MAAFFLWCLLLVVCWPLALLALVAYPFVWLLLLPFRIVGIAVGGVFELLACDPLPAGARFARAARDLEAAENVAALLSSNSPENREI